MANYARATRCVTKGLRIEEVVSPKVAFYYGNNISLNSQADVIVVVVDLDVKVVWWEGVEAGGSPHWGVKDGEWSVGWSPAQGVTTLFFLFFLRQNIVLEVYQFQIS